MGGGIQPPPPPFLYAVRPRVNQGLSKIFSKVFFSTCNWSLQNTVVSLLREKGNA